ncbi:MAG: hypothetical protein KVP17_004686 [Porospora cf. gigantea B]|nr:MAG: hypothetical protein KVP17_004686 [Porospora cf. gigantea B]
MEELRVPHIHETYRSLRKKGFTFPPRGQKLESPPRTADARSDLLPVTDKQILQLQKAVYLVETSDDVDLIKRCVDIFVRMTPKVERRVQILSQEGHQEPYGEVKLKTLLELNDKLQSAIVKRDAGEFEKPAKPVVNDLLDMGPSPTGPAAVTPQTSMSLTPSIRPSEDPFADLMSCFDTQPESVKAVDAPTVPREEAETVSDAMSAPSLTPAVWSGDFPKASSVDMDPEQVDPVAESFNHGVLSSSDEEEQLAAWLKDNQHLKPLEKPRRATGSDEDDFRSIPESDTDSSQRHRVAALSEDPFGGDIDWSKLDAEMEDALV